jgi:hypothetical protein
MFAKAVKFPAFSMPAGTCLDGANGGQIAQRSITQCSPQASILCLRGGELPAQRDNVAIQFVDKTLNVIAEGTHLALMSHRHSNFGITEHLGISLAD